MGIGIHPKTRRLIRLIFLSGKLPYSKGLEIYKNKKSYEDALESLQKQEFITIHNSGNPEKYITLTGTGYVLHFLLAGWEG